MVGQSFELFRIRNHEHLVLLVNPPMVLLPLLVVRVNHLREELVFVRLVVREVIVQTQVQSFRLVLGGRGGEEIPLDYLSEILEVFVLLDHEGAHWSSHLNFLI